MVCWCLRFLTIKPTKCNSCNNTAARLKAPRLASTLSDTTVAIQLFPLTSSTHDHVTHYYIGVVPANLRIASNDVRLDEVYVTL